MTSLKDRLLSIKTKPPEHPPQKVNPRFPPDWLPVAEGVLKWEDLVPFKKLRDPELGLAILAPDFFPFFEAPPPRLPEIPVRIFDFETTGLSGGAGTVAFLAAFGAFEKDDRGHNALRITQYLLLDYPAEADFILAFLPELGNSEDKKFVLSYNGKCFDFQILRTRCLMNGIELPEFYPADLLHPCRRLWKRRLPSCSQATIETSILDLDRSTDLPGSFAPDIWRDFLKHGNTSDLLRVCEHNRRDIFGLASIFALFLEMASAPLNSLDRVDRERVAVRWWEVLRYHKAFFNEHCPPDDKQTQQDLCRQLLLANADLPRVAFLLAKDLSAEGAYDEARAKLHFVHEHKESSPYLRAKALLRLAADAQHRLNDKELAHSYRTKAKQLHEVRPGNPQNSIAKT